MSKLIQTVWRYRKDISYIVVILFLAVVFASSSLRNIKSIDALSGKLKIQLDSTRTLMTNNGQLVQAVTHLKKTTSADLKAYSDRIFNLEGNESKLIREVTRLSIIKQRVSLNDTIVAQYDVTTRPDIENISCDSLADLFQFAVLTPAPFSYSSDSISLQGVVMPPGKGVAITKVDIPDSLIDRDVVERFGFLNLSKRTSTQYYHSNSLFRTDSAAVLTVNMTPSWWHRTGKPATFGIIGAAAVIIIQSLAK